MVVIYFIPRTPPYIIYGVRVRGIKHPCPKGVNAAGNPGELADYKPRETADSRQATERARTGVGARGREADRRADRDGRTPHGARTRGWRRLTGGARVLPANRAVGHTDEVNTTNRVTLFAGAASDSRPLLRVNPRKLNENPRKGKTDERTKHTKSGSEIDRRARRQGTAGNLHRGLRDTRDPASGKRPEAAPGDRRPCKARAGNRPGADRSTAAGPAVVSMRGRP